MIYNSILLKEYLSVLRLEKNFSPNTVDSYGNDISKLLEFTETCGLQMRMKLIKPSQ